MTGAGQDWARLGAAAAQDAALAPFAAGALLLWDARADRPGFANPAALALLGGEHGSPALPQPARQRFAALAGGLAPRDGVRLERLRLKPGFAATQVTCGCKLLTGADGAPVLAVAVAPSELRRLGVVVPASAPEAAPPAGEAFAAEAAGSDKAAEPTLPPAPDEPEHESAPAAGPRRATVRFLWRSDAAGEILSVSPEIVEALGPQAAALSGRNWSNVIGRDLIDAEGGLNEALASAATWSGHAVLWRTSTPGQGVRVELSGAPVFGAGRVFDGYRGFGLARLAMPAPFPAPEELEEADRESSGEAAAESPTAEDVAVSGSPADQAACADAGADLPEEPAVAAETGGQPEDDVAAARAALDETKAGTASLASDPDAGDAQSSVEPPSREAEASATPALDQGRDEIAPRMPEIAPSANVFPLRNGHLTAVRPVLEPSKANLSSAERNAFREIAKALGARIAGDDETAPRLPPAGPLQLRNAEDEIGPAPPDAPSDARIEAIDAAAPRAPADDAASVDEPVAIEPAALSGSEAAQSEPRARAPNSHADLLDRLPLAVLVNHGEEALYANRALLELLDYADLDDLAASGGVSRMIKGASRVDGGAMLLIDRRGRLVSVDASLSSLTWQGEPATLMAFRQGDASRGGALPDSAAKAGALTAAEALEAELAEEFAAEEAESAARVEALRLDVDAREGRIAELVAMLDTATDGVVTLDERGRMLSLNKAAEALFGYDQREVTGELFTLLFAAESHSPALDYLEGLKGGGVASVMNDGREIVGRVRQGGRIPLFMTMGRIAEGADRRFCAVLRDITAWKKTEGELVEARKAAEKASAQKSDVLAKISHEIRTPLNAIIGFAEVMAEERFGPIANERYKEYLRDIHSSGGYVISLVNDLLDLAKIEAGKLDLDFVGVSLNEIALSAVSLLQPEANRGRVVLRSGLSPKLPPVVADQRSIRQIVINLLSNAVKFTDAGGQVIVSTALGDQGEAILRVRDTGIGMDDHEIALALEPFRQVPTTRRKGGTGLGLPLTKALVEANRAAMSITSVKKEGTLVEITFPPQRVLAG